MVYVAWYNILTVGVDMFQFHVKIVKDLAFLFISFYLKIL
jgi:hypothetical protein